MDDFSRVTRDQLLAHAGWVRSLARTLVRDEARASDVEQSVWLEALERPPRVATNLKAWLGRVTTHAAQQMGRGDTRRTRREARVAREGRPAPPAAELVEQAEAQQELVDAVMSLRASQRDLVLRHFMGGESLRSIARGEGRHPSTVHERLAVALRELERHLEGRYGGERGPWMHSIGLLALARPRGAWAAWPLVGGVLMLGKVLAAAAVLVVGSWFLWGGSGGSRVDPPVEEQVVATSQEAVRVPPVLAPGVEEPGADVRSPVARESGETLLGGRVIERIGRADGAPVADARVGVYEKVGAWRRSEPLVEVTTDEEGRFFVGAVGAGNPLAVRVRKAGYGDRFEDLGEEELVVRLRPVVRATMHVVDAETGLPVLGARINDAEQVSPGTFRFENQVVSEEHHYTILAKGYAVQTERETFYGREDCELTYALLKGAPRRLQVLDLETGKPLPGVQVKLEEATVETGGDGTVEVFAHPRESARIWLDHPGYVQSHWTTEDLDPEKMTVLGLLPFARATGRVVDEEGRPVRGARVRLFQGNGVAGRDEVRRAHEVVLSRSESLELAGLRTGFPEERRSTHADRMGRFELPAIPGRGGIFIVEAPGFLELRSQPTCFHLGRTPEEVELHLERPGVLRGRILLNDAPARGGSVESRVSGVWRGTVPIGPGGNYELPLGRGGHTVRALDGWGRVMGEEGPIEVAAGEERTLDFDLTAERATISGRVTDMRGEPLAGVKVHASVDRGGPSAGPQPTGTAQTNRNGRYTMLVGVEDTLRLSVPWGPRGESRGGVAPGSEHVDFQLPDLARLSLELVEGGTGKAVRLNLSDYRAVYLWRSTGDRGPFRRLSLEEDGTLSLQAYAGSRVDLSLSFHDMAYPQVQLFDIPLPEVEGTLRVEIPQGHPLELRFTGESVPGIEDPKRFYLLREEEVVRHSSSPGEKPVLRQGGDYLSTRGIVIELARPVPGEPGRFHLAAVEEGTYLVASRAEVSFEPSVIDVKPGGGVVEVRWQLPR